MASKPFFDTNILLYLLSADEAKAQRAEELVGSGGVVSIQILNEFASVATRKLQMSIAEIGECLDPIVRVCRVEPITLETHATGLGVAAKYGFSIYDSMVVAAALLADCNLLYTEDLQDGQRIGKLRIKNPFKGP